MADWTLIETKIANVRRALLETRSMLREVQANAHPSVEDLQYLTEKGAALEVDVAELVEMLDGAPAAQVTDIWAVSRSAKQLIAEIEKLQGGGSVQPMPELPYDVQSTSRPPRAPGEDT